MTKKSRINWWGFTSQLFLVIVLPLTVLILVVAFGSQTLHHDAMRSLVGDRDLKAVRAAANSLELEIMHLSSTIQTIGRETGTRTDFSDLTFTKEELAASFEAGIAMFSADGRFISAMQPAEFWSNLKKDLPGYFDSVLKSQSTPVFSSPLVLPNENKTYILVATVTGNQNILVGAFTPASLVQKSLSGFVSSGQMSALVISRKSSDGDFEVLYQAGPFHPDEQLDTHPGIRNSLNGESGINYFQAAEGEHVVAFSSVAPIGWGLVIEEAWEDIASPYLRTTQAAPLAIVPVFLLALVALWFGARRIVRPLQALEKQASELAEGDFEAIRKPVGGIEEIHNLQSELITMADRLKTAQQSLRSYIGAITAGIENERRSIARELHDDTIQSLIALNQRIQLTARKTSPSDKNDLAELQDLVQQTMTNLRRMVRGLRPIYLEDLGLVASLEMLSRETSQTSSIPIQFTTKGAEHRLDPQVEMSLYRIVQESLSNITRHSEARQAWVELSFVSDEFKIEIRDNGKGFVVPVNSSGFSKKGHFGLVGLQERAEIIGADLHLTSIPGQGTTVQIHLKGRQNSLLETS